MKDRLLNFLRETLAEMKKVVWPDRRYVLVATSIVLVLVILTMFFLMFVDWGFSEIFKVLLRR